MQQQAQIEYYGSTTTINPSGGVNPIDSTAITLRNVRGIVVFEVTSEDNSYTWSFEVRGGLGEYQTSPEKNWAVRFDTVSGATLTYPSTNTFIFTTPAGDAGGRTYEIKFYTYDGKAPVIRKTGGAAIGNNAVTVKQIHPQLIPIYHF